MLIRSILRWKTALALKRSCNFSRAKIERINTVARHVLLQKNIILPRHLVTSAGFFEGLIRVSFKSWHLNMIYFLNVINLAQKCEICIIDLLAKASWMQCPLQNQKVSKPGFDGAACQLAPSNIWTHQVHNLPTSSALVTSVVIG